MPTVSTIGVGNNTIPHAMGPGRGSGLEDFNAAAKKQRPSTVGEAPLPPSKQTRLVIIGAGFAGLSAARTIQGAGERIEVIVLEASSAVGGRVRSGAVGSRERGLSCAVSCHPCECVTLTRIASSQLPSGARVELGATWFHGIQGNPLYDIAVWEGLIRDLRGDPGEPTMHAKSSLAPTGNPILSPSFLYACIICLFACGRVTKHLYSLCFLF